jgi:UDP-N-acetylglucosamine--N-acetylmuramyl-(pentapeptide) pyrophosphoryl-undecaprenol N-acetylglucosamine transferase
MVENAGIEFKPIFSGKLRRYFSWRNFITPFLIVLGFVQSFFIILRWRPDLVMSAGSFTSVPAVWAAWLLRVPVLIHQQDARPGLANKLMAPFARAITVTFEKSLADYGKKAVWTGNPVRQFSIFPPEADQPWAGKQFSIKEIRKKFGLRDDMPTVLVIGGGTGALAINELINKALPELTKFCRIIHITGKDKKPNIKYQISNYKNYDFLNAEQMAEAYAAADVVISRCGMGVLTELSYLGKPTILIPMPDSHQEENAAIFAKKKAAIVLNQEELTPEKLADNIKKLLNDEMLRGKLSGNIKEVIKRGANEEIVKIVEHICKIAI